MRSVYRKVISMVGPGVYPAVCSFLSDLQRARIGSGVLRAVSKDLWIGGIGRQISSADLSDRYSNSFRRPWWAPEPTRSFSTTVGPGS